MKQLFNFLFSKKASKELSIRKEITKSLFHTDYITAVERIT